MAIDVPLVTLKKRAEFLAVRGGARCATPAFVLEAKPRRAQAKPRSVEFKPRSVDGGPRSVTVDAPVTVDADAAAAEAGPRFGFTITKKIGIAVVRNRIRRRLRAALTQQSEPMGRPGYDYVVIARAPAADIPFTDLQKDLERALQRVHHAGASRPRQRPGRDT